MNKTILTLSIWFLFLLGAYGLRSIAGASALFVYLAGANVLGFALMLADKRRARIGARRISEAALFRVTAAGGGIGAIAGMYGARHKTRKWQFRLGFPLLTALNAVWLYAWYV